MHSADAIADALFWIVSALLFRRRGESQFDSVRRLFNMPKGGRGEGSTNSCLFTADRSYGKESFTELLTLFGFSSALIIPGHLLRVHPFVASSFRNPNRGDEVE